MKTKINAPQIAIDPSTILEMAHGYWASQVLYVATKLRIFSVLTGKSSTLKKIVSSIKTPLHSTERLLNACCALNLLQKENSKYSNSPLSESFLVEGKDGYLGHLIFLMDELYMSWGKLLKSVKEDKPVRRRFGDGIKISKRDARFFTLAMHSSSSGTAPFLAEAIDLSGYKKLLDLGGGPGVNTIVLAEKNPQLEAVVYDFPAVIKVAREFISQSKAANRIKTIAGDYNKDDLPKGFDCILLSHILHGEGKKGSQCLLRKCYDILEPSGKIIIVDFLLNENKTGPVFPALFALNMLVETAEGDTFTAQEITRFLKNSGFIVGEIKSLGGSSPASIVIATKLKG